MKLAPQSNAAYLANLNAMKELFSSFHVSVKDVIEGTSVDAEGKEQVKIVMYIEACGDTVRPVSLHNVRRYESSVNEMSTLELVLTAGPLAKLRL